MHTHHLIRSLIALFAIASPLYAQGQGNRIFGKGHPFTSEELPNGKLKEKFKALPPQARARALKWMNSITFSAGDASSYLRLDVQGGVFIVCPIDGCGCDDPDHDHNNHEEEPPDEAGDDAGSGDEVTGHTPIGDGSNETFQPTAAVSVNAPPVFHSKPDAPYHIYLDFNGAQVSGKAWTYSDGTNTWSSWDCEAWSTDGDVTTFSVAEQNDIRRMWERIAEDYAPFNVNVTTDAAYDPDNYTGDKNKVGWLLTTPTTDKNGVRCPHFGYGGIAYVNVFGVSNYFSNYQPAWVTPMGAANIAEAASHEMGHNMGLSHDALTTGAAYYGGHAGTASAPSWGPIMGTGYNRDVTQWSKGEYFNGNQSQDDLAIIAGKVPYRSDDHGDSFPSATAWTQIPVSQSGTVERTDNPDVFTFTTGAGAISFNATTYRADTQTWGGNLDVTLELYNASQTLVASANPGAETDAVLNAIVPAGTYYLVLKPAAAGDPLDPVPSGYTSYGSLGYYRLTGMFNPVDSIFLTVPNGGETWFVGTPNEISWTSGVAGNVKIELFKDGVLHSTLSSATENDGSFLWMVPAAQLLGNDYQVRITSLERPDIFAQSLSNVTIAIDPLAIALDTSGYSWRTSGTMPWFTQSVITNDGVDAAQSATIGDDQTSSMETTITGPGTMTFWWRVSSESGYDFLRFYLDGVEQTGALARISGTVNWVQRSVSIPGGTHTVKWSYAKDGSVAGGADAAWVDQVLFTADDAVGSLAITPTAGINAVGSFGGPFSPTTLQYTLSNPGSTPIQWTVAKTQDWLTLNASNGLLNPGSSTSITGFINSAAATLDVGGYADVISFTNVTNGMGNSTRAVNLTVNTAVASVSLGDLQQEYDGAPKAVTVTTSPPGLAHVVTYQGSSELPTNAGNYAVVATITAPNYSGTASGMLTINKASQTISFATLAPVPNDVSSLSLNATASSGLAVSYTSSNSAVATVSGNQVTITGLGTTTITAGQEGDANFQVAASVPQVLTVVRANPLAVAGSSYVVLIGQELSLNGSASQPSHDAMITEYSWDLNRDGVFGDVVGATPAVIAFTDLTNVWGMTEGTNAISLRVTDSSNKTATISTSVFIVSGLTWDANGTDAGPSNGAGTWWGADLWWNGSGHQSWISGSNASFGGGNSPGGAVTLSAPTSVDRMTFDEFTGTYTIGSSGQALSIAGGITKNPSSAAVSLISPITLMTDQLWSNQSAGVLSTATTINAIQNQGYTLTVDGSGPVQFGIINSTATALSGSGALVKKGTSLLAVGGVNSGLTGSVLIEGGTLRMFNNTGALGTGNITLNGGVLEPQAGLSLNRALGSGPGQIQVTGGVSGFSQNANGQTTTVLFNNDATSEVVWGTSFFSPDSLVLTADTASGGAVTSFANRLDLNGTSRTIHTSGGTAGLGRAVMAGQIRNSQGLAGLSKTGTGVLTLSNAANAWNGPTKVFGGVLDLAGISNANLGGGSGRNVSVAADAAIRFNALSNAFLNRIIETDEEITIMTGTTTNNLDFSGAAGANLPNAFLGNWTSTATKAECTGIITPAADAYRLGSPRSNGLLGLTNTAAMTGNRGLIIGGGSVELVGAKTFNGTTVIRSGGRLGLAASGADNGVALALQNSTLDLDVSGGTFWLEAATSAGPIFGAAATNRVVFGGLRGGRSLTSAYTTVTGANNGAATPVTGVTGVTLNLAAGKVETYAGDFADFASGTTLGKTGAGTQIFSGLLSHTGKTSVQAGTLVIDGSLSDAAAPVQVASGATLGGRGIIGRDVAIASGGRLAFAIQGTAATHDSLELTGGRSLSFAGAAEITITSNGLAQPGTYVLITGGNPISGPVPASLQLPANWLATVSVSGNSLLLHLISTMGDVMVPQVMDISDDKNGSAVLANTTVLYTVTFNEAMDSSTVDVSDFGNAGTAPVVIQSVSSSSPGIYQVAVSPTGAGSLQLRINAGAVLRDLAGNTLSTGNAINDDTIIPVMPLNSPPVAQSQSLTTPEDAALPVTLSGTDVDGDSLEFTVVSLPSNGTLSGTVPNVIYTPNANYHGADTFQFRVSDGSLSSTVATVSIMVQPVNDAPVAMAQSVSTAEDTAVAITLSGSDIEGDILSYVIVTPPGNGTLSGVAPNLFFTPAANFNGSTAFAFRVNDGALNSANAVVSISVAPVNDAPVADARSISTAEDTAVAITLSGSDIEGDNLTYSIVTPPANGTLSGVAPNLFFTPAVNFNGGTAFTFRVNDGALNSADVMVNITVAPVNDAPVADARSISTPEDTAVAITLTGSDSENSPLSFTVVSPPANGTLSGVAPNLTFTPSAHFKGSTSFSFRVSDGSLNSSNAIVSITVTSVNDAPVFLTNPLVLANGSVGLAYTGQTLAGRATDADEGDTLAFSKVSGPAWLSVAANGTLSGTPPSGSTGLNSFIVRATDSGFASADATLQINIIGLPLPWIASDIGTGMLAGSTTFASGTFTQAGSGIIGGTSSNFRFTYQTLSGDGEIIARISALQNTGNTSRVGVMIRDSLAANSKEIFIGLGGSNTYNWSRRTATGGKTSNTTSSTGTLPNTWVRLVRTGTTITAYKSTNGTTWTTVGSTTKTTFAANCYIGLAVGSGSNTVLNTSQFTNVSVTP